MNTPLTPVEIAIANRLKKKVKGAGCFGEMMRMVFHNGEPRIIRQLISDIKSQIYCAPDETAKIIGFKTFLMILRLTTADHRVYVMNSGPCNENSYILDI